MARDKVTSYIACVRVVAAIDPDVTRVPPHGIAVVTKPSDCTNVRIGWSLVESTAVAAMPIVRQVAWRTSSDLDRDYKGDSGQLDGSRMNSLGLSLSPKPRDTAPVPESNHCVRRADQGQGNRDPERKNRIVETHLREGMQMNSNAKYHG